MIGIASMIESTVMQTNMISTAGISNITGNTTAGRLTGIIPAPNTGANSTGHTGKNGKCMSRRDTVVPTVTGGSGRPGGVSSNRIQDGSTGIQAINSITAGIYQIAMTWAINQTAHTTGNRISAAILGIAAASDSWNPVVQDTGGRCPGIIPAAWANETV